MQQNINRQSNFCPLNLSPKNSRFPELTAFSLIELAIVLVIMGLLISGIVGAKSLIDSSKVMALSNELNQFTVAVNAFNLKYDAYPGDYEKATLRIDNSLENGNGDGYIGYYDPDDLTTLENWTFILDSSKTLESKMFFAHLFAAKILSLNFISTPDTPTLALANSLIPTSVAAEDSHNLAGRMVNGYYKSKAFPEAILFPRVDAGNNYTNAVNSLALINSRALEVALVNNTLDVVKLTSVFPGNSMLKLKQKLANAECRTGDCLVTGNIYIRAFSIMENNGFNKGDSCLSRKSNEPNPHQQLILNHRLNKRKCSLGYSLNGDGLTLKEQIPAEQQPGADISKCYQPPITNGIDWASDIINDGDKIHGTCSVGYSQLSGQPEPSALCSNGNWTNIVHSCFNGCSQAPAINNAQTITGSHYSNDTTVELNCNSGYYNSSTQSNTVLASCAAGKWTYNGTCSDSSCNNLEAPEVAFASWNHSDITASGSQLTYTCQEGYRVVSDDSHNNTTSFTVTCHNTVWDPVTARCVINTCYSNQHTLANANPASWSAASTTVGSTITGSCAAGYGYVTFTSPQVNSYHYGEKRITATCNEGGIWSYNKTCETIGCDISDPNVLPIANKNYDADNWSFHLGSNNKDSSKKVWMQTGSYAQATCKPGFYFPHSGDSRYNSTFAYCDGLNSIYWYPKYAQACIIGCPAPTTIANTTSTSNQALKNNVYPQNTQVAYQCNSGFYNSTNSSSSSLGTSTCQTNGNWKQTLSGSCITGCNTEPAIANATKTNTSLNKINNTYPRNTTITFNCNSGYYGNNDSASITATCQADGSWSYSKNSANANASCVRVCDRNVLAGSLITGSRFYPNSSNPGVNSSNVYANKRYFADTTMVDADCASGYTELGTATSGGYSNTDKPYGGSGHHYYCQNGIWKPVGSCMIKLVLKSTYDANKYCERYYLPGTTVNCHYSKICDGGKDPHSGYDKKCYISNVKVADQYENVQVKL